METLDSDVLLDEGCFTSNCDYVSYQVLKQDRDVLGNMAKNGSTVVQLILQKPLKTTVYKHMMAYGFSNFVADFGGYLGLLLGASLLSIYDWVMEIMENNCKK